MSVTPSQTALAALEDIRGWLKKLLEHYPRGRTIPCFDVLFDEIRAALTRQTTTHQDSLQFTATDVNGDLIHIKCRCDKCKATKQEGWSPIETNPK